MAVLVCVYASLIPALFGCAPTPTPALFLPPTLPPLAPPTSQPIIDTPLPTPTLPEPTPTPPCSDGLTFLQDVTFPDGSYVSAAQPIDKQWLVTNSGTCNWDARYRLRLMEGDALGVAGEQALYPARAGTQVVIRMHFTAPAAPNTYRSQWRAFGPDGQAFGDPIYIEIIVSP